VRQLGAWCLAGVGYDVKAALPQLAATLDDHDDDVQGETFEALRILGRFSPDHVLPILLKKLNHISDSPITDSKGQWATSIIRGLLQPQWSLLHDAPRFKEPIAGAMTAVVPELWRIVKQPVTDEDDRRAHNALKREAFRSLKRLQAEAAKNFWMEEITRDWDAREECLLSRLREARASRETAHEAQYSALKEISLTNTTPDQDTSLEELAELEKLRDAKTTPQGDINELPFPAGFDPMTLRETQHADNTTLHFAIEGEAAWACMPCGVVSNSCRQEDVAGEKGNGEDGTAARASDGDAAANKSQKPAIGSVSNTECDASGANGTATAEGVKQVTSQQRWQKGEIRRRRHFLNANNTHQRAASWIRRGRHFFNANNTHQRAAFWCAFSTHYFKRLSQLEGGDPFHQWTRSSQDPMPLQDLEGFFVLRARREAATCAMLPPRDRASGMPTVGPRRGRPYPRCLYGEEEEE